MKPITAIVFEGGKATSSVVLSMLDVRKAICLDNIETLVNHPHYDRVILATNYPDLAEEARNMGATIVDTSDWLPFHFGQALTRIVREFPMERALYFSGASSPLISYDEFTEIAQVLNENENVVYVNNVQSADIVAWTPAQVLLNMDPPELDNALGYEIRYQNHFTRLLMPHSAGIHFDVDTPTEILFLKLLPNLKPRTRKAVDAMAWSTKTLERAWEVLKTRGKIPSVWISGRVGAPLIAHFNLHISARLRIVSEERGMKAMGLEDSGKVRSFIGSYIENVGPEAFFQWVSESASVAFLDTRPIFAHMQIHPSDHDRFNSDLGNWQEIKDPFIREFTKAALEAPIPVVLGGHTLVLGGLWVIIDDVHRERALRRQQKGD